MEKDFERIDALGKDVELLRHVVLNSMKNVEKLMLSYVDIVKRYEELFTQLVIQSAESTKVSESK